VVTELDCVFVGIDVGLIVFECFILLEGNVERDTDTLVVDVLDCIDDFVFVTDTELVFVLDVLPVILLVFIGDLEDLLEIVGILVVVSNDEYVVVAVGDIVNTGIFVFVTVTVFVSVFLLTVGEIVFDVDDVLDTVEVLEFVALLVGVIVFI
jgi:hypothetical protein